MDTQLRTLALVETIGSILWYLMDGCWVLSALPDVPAPTQWYLAPVAVLISTLKLVAWTPLAKAFIAPTFAVNLWAFRYTERTLSAMAITIAMNCWLGMNILCMLGDMNRHPELTLAGVQVLLLGLLCLLVACMRTRQIGQPFGDVAQRFRRFRLTVLGRP